MCLQDPSRILAARNTRTKRPHFTDGQTKALGLRTCPGLSQQGRSRAGKGTQVGVNEADPHPRASFVVVLEQKSGLSLWGPASPPSGPRFNHTLPQCHPTVTIWSLALTRCPQAGATVSLWPPQGAGRLAAPDSHHSRAAHPPPCPATRPAGSTSTGSLNQPSSLIQEHQLGPLSGCHLLGCSPSPHSGHRAPVTLGQSKRVPLSSEASQGSPLTQGKSPSPPQGPQGPARPALPPPRPPSSAPSAPAMPSSSMFPNSPGLVLPPGLCTGCSLSLEPSPCNTPMASGQCQAKHSPPYPPTPSMKQLCSVPHRLAELSILLRTGIFQVTG